MSRKTGNELLKQLPFYTLGGTWTHSLSIRSRARYPLRH